MSNVCEFLIPVLGRRLEEEDAIAEFVLNGNILATPTVKRNGEAEFDHWSDEEVSFPVIQVDDKLVIKYKGEDVLSGVFLSA